MKTCRRCSVAKKSEDFRADKRCRDGLASWCRDCYRQYARSWGKENRERVRRSEEKYLASKPFRVQWRDRLRTLRRHGVDQDWYRNQLAFQRGLCAICHGPATVKGFSIDHCHTTGRVRGLLCSPCNTAIGLLQDDPPLLRAAADYLEMR